MIPMYPAAVAHAGSAADLDANWVYWLVRQRTFSLGGMIDVSKSGVCE